MLRLIEDLRSSLHDWLLVEDPGLAAGLLLLHYLSWLRGRSWWRLLVEEGRLLSTAGLAGLVEDARLGLHHGLLEGDLFHLARVGTIRGLLVDDAWLLQDCLIVNLLLGRFSARLTHAYHRRDWLGWL